MHCGYKVFNSPCEKSTANTGHKGHYGDTRDPQEHIEGDYSLLHIFSQMLIISPYPKDFEIFRVKNIKYKKVY